jgi:hypothetical protein
MLALLMHEKCNLSNSEKCYSFGMQSHVAQPSGSHRKGKKGGISLVSALLGKRGDGELSLVWVCFHQTARVKNAK